VDVHGRSNVPEEFSVGPKTRSACVLDPAILAISKAKGRGITLRASSWGIGDGERKSQQ
jgi:hypothetical protein